jgi:hypothetical protein
LHFGISLRLPLWFLGTNTVMVLPQRRASNKRFFVVCTRIWNISFDKNGDFFIDYHSTASLFPDEDRPIGEEIQWAYVVNDAVRIALMKADEEGENIVLKWTLYADDMEPKRGTHPIKLLHDFS